MFKLTGELSLENVTLRKNLDMGCVKIRWDDICIILNERVIHLPTTLIIPLIHKQKVRKLFGKRDLLEVYIMLKQRKPWYKLEGEGSKTCPEKCKVCYKQL